MKDGLYVVISEEYADGVYDFTKFIPVEDFCPAECVTIYAIKRVIERCYCVGLHRTLYIVDVENNRATVCYKKVHHFGKKTYWKKINNVSVDVSYYTEAIKRNTNEPAEVENQPAEADSQPAEADSQPAEADSQPAEADSQPADEPAKANKLKGRYIAIQMKFINVDNDMIDRYYLFDVSLETNKYNIMKFADSFVNYSIAVAYILDVYQKNIIIRSKKVYIPNSRNYWIRKKDVLSKTFLDDFRK